MKRQRVHVVVGGNEVAQAWIIRSQHVGGQRRLDIAVVVMGGMKQQRGVAVDADVADAEKKRTG